MASLRGVSCEPAIRPASRGRSLVLPASLTPPRGAFSCRSRQAGSATAAAATATAWGGSQWRRRQWWSVLLLYLLPLPPSPFIPHFSRMVRCCQLKGGSFLPPPAPRKSREERLGDVREPLLSALRSCVVCYSLWSRNMFGEVRIRKVARELM